MSDPLERLNLALGDRYSIERELGEGGMATVYLALDLKHDRKVALKVLKPELAAVIGGERFLVEIKTTANLQHPHILPLFDSGEEDGFLYYVMPFVEGESLRDKLDRERQLGVDEAIHITKAVASALQYAHDRDVIHRDIKPENVLLHAGEPVVADFGIALALSAAGGGRMTETGLSLGTPHYMSPEQATADRDLSSRSDVYSLACVLYEMLTGDPPHTGPTAQAILIRILTEEPRSVTDVRKSVPPHVTAVLAKALEKLPADRFDSAEAFSGALSDPGFVYQPTSRTSAPTTSATPAALDVTDRSSAPLMRLLPWGVAALFAVATAASWLRPDPPEPVRRFSITLDNLSTISIGPSFALSPDGSTLAYMGLRNELYVRPLSSLSAQVIANTEESRAPFFSPTGRSIGFTQGPAADDIIRTVSLDGAPVARLAGDHFPGATWGEDGFVYFTDLPGVLYRVLDNGGGEREVLADSTTGFRFSWPQALPGGGALLLTTTSPEGATVSTFDVDTKELKLQGSASYARFAGGYLFWVNADAALMAARFDVARLEIVSEGVPVASGMHDAGEGSGEFAVSDNGTLVYSSSGEDQAAAGEVLGWMDRSGRFTPMEDPFPPDIDNFASVSISPDGGLIAVEVQTLLPGTFGEFQIWIYDQDRGDATRLTFRGTANREPDWLPNGRTVAYVSDQGEEAGTQAIYVLPYDGSGTDRLFYQANRDIVTFDIGHAEDSPLIILGLFEPFGGLFLGDVQEASPPEAFLSRDSFVEAAPALSPDGQWVAYMSDESGIMEVYVRAYPEGPRPFLISRQGGWVPLWSRAGDELFYIDSEGQLTAAELEIDAAVSVTQRTALFSTLGYQTGENLPQPKALYDVSPDGQRFLMIGVAGSRPGEALVVVLNLFEELEQRLGN